MTSSQGGNCKDCTQGYRLDKREAWNTTFNLTADGSGRKEVGVCEKVGCTCANGIPKPGEKCSPADAKAKKDNCLSCDVDATMKPGDPGYASCTQNKCTCKHGNVTEVCVENGEE